MIDFLSSVRASSFEVDGHREKRPWTAERIARLGFLIGLGWSVESVADDPIVASIPNNVRRQAQRFGLSFRAVASAWCLPPEAIGFFGKAAAKRGLTREALIRMLLIEVAADPYLLDNILDDGIGQ